MTDETPLDPFAEALPRAVAGAQKIRELIKDNLADIPNHNTTLCCLVLLASSIKQDLLSAGECDCGTCAEVHFLSQGLVDLLNIFNTIELVPKNKAKHN